MTRPELFVAAQDALGHTVAHIKNDQWNQEVPPEMTTRQPSMTLREIINRHAYDDAWVPDTLKGKTIADIGDKFDGDLLGDDPKTAYAGIAAAASAAVSDLSDTDLDKNVHLTYGEFPAHEYLLHILLYRAFRAYDIAEFIGLKPHLNSELTQGLWDALEPRVEEFRAMGVFGPIVDIPDTASLEHRLLGLTGRQPHAED